MTDDIMRQAAKLLQDFLPEETGFVLLAMTPDRDIPELTEILIRANVEPETVRNALRYALDAVEASDGTLDPFIDMPRPN